jgi:subtilisin family serine protease
MRIRDQIEATGHARVMVVLKQVTRRVKGRVQLARMETRDVQRESAEKLMHYFKVFDDSRASLISREHVRELATLANHGIIAGRPAAFGDLIALGVTAVVDAVPASSPVSGVRYFPNLGVLLGTIDQGGWDALAAAKDEVSALAVPPEFSLIRPAEEDGAALAGIPPGVSWALERMKIPQLWADGLTGEGILVGHLDTGVDATHPALAGAIDVFAGFDELGNQVVGAPTKDSGFHGTHTAGLLVGRTVDGSSFGTAPGAKLASAAVIERGDVPARVIAGLEWCIGQGCRLINLSLGIRGYDPAFTTIMSLLRQRGVLPIAAVGNEGPVTSRSPGNYTQVISVGACNEADEVWVDSSSQTIARPRRTAPDLIAPGQRVWSCVPGGRTVAMSGTSMAAPHVSGLAALLMEHKPEATIDQIEKAILDSCQRPPGASTIRANRGIPDAVVARDSL